VRHPRSPTSSADRRKSCSPSSRRLSRLARCACSQ
jgi:hypothetical protein